MSDIYCRKCGEPWDAWGARHGEMEADEWRRFVRGEGCPCCAFGANVEDDGFEADATMDFLTSLDEATDGDEIWDAIEALETIAD